jgi:hypothetical protein
VDDSRGLVSVLPKSALAVGLLELQVHPSRSELMMLVMRDIPISARRTSHYISAASQISYVNQARLAWSGFAHRLHARMQEQKAGML